MEIVEDSHIARTIAAQIEREEEEFDHYLTIQVDSQRGPDDLDYRWRRFDVGAREMDLYVAERSSSAEGVSVGDVTELQDELERIAARAGRWRNVDVEVEAKDILSTLQEEGLTIPAPLAPARIE